MSVQQHRQNLSTPASIASATGQWCMLCSNAFDVCLQRALVRGTPKKQKRGGGVLCSP